MADYPVDEVLLGDENIRYYVSHNPQNLSVVVKDTTCHDMAEVTKYLREGVVAAEIAHPNICRMLHMFLTHDGSNQHVKIVFELVRKRLDIEIQERQRRNPPGHFSEEELRVFLTKIASALQLAHSRGVAHRNIDPKHIYITPSGEYKLSDLGEAWRGAEERSMAKTVSGQFSFMCPKMKRAVSAGLERVEEGYDEKKADVYSLGVTLLNMGTLYPPSTLSSMRNHDINVEKLLAAVTEHGIRSQFVDIIRNMLKVEEAERFISITY